MAAAEDEKVEDELSEATRDLIDAIAKKEMDDLRSALISGADINVKTKMTATSKFVQTPLHYAIRKKFTKGALVLIKSRRIDLEAVCEPSKRTALHLASFYALSNVVCALLDKGVNAVATDRRGLLPINIIGEKYPTDPMKRPKGLVDSITEIQLMLLEASTSVVASTKKSYDTEIAKIEAGLSALKTEANETIQKVQAEQGMKFNVMWPYKYAELPRYKVWALTHKSVSAFLESRFLKVEVRVVLDEEMDRAHMDFSKCKDFQIAMAKEALTGGGLDLAPERPPKCFAKKAKKKVTKKKSAAAKKKKPKKAKAKKKRAAAS